MREVEEREDKEEETEENRFMNDYYKQKGVLVEVARKHMNYFKKGYMTRNTNLNPI